MPAHLPAKIEANSQLNTKIDTFSFGILLFGLVTGKSPTWRNPGVNFTNILRAVLLNKNVMHTFSLLTVWLCQKNIGAKAARKMLMKLTTVSHLTMREIMIRASTPVGMIDNGEISDWSNCLFYIGKVSISSTFLKQIFFTKIKSCLSSAFLNLGPIQIIRDTFLTPSLPPVAF